MRDHLFRVKLWGCFVAVTLLCLGFCLVATAQTCTVFLLSGKQTPIFQSASDACAAYNGSSSNGTTVVTFSGSAPTSIPAANSTGQCDATETQSPTGSASFTSTTTTGVFVGGIEAVSSSVLPGGSASCMNPCAIGSSANLMASTGSATISSISANSFCGNGCEYKAPPVTLILTEGATQSTALGGAIATGNSCSTSDATATAGSNCFLSKGQTICASQVTGMASVNGDAIPMNAPPASGQCVVYASGGSLCTVPSGSTVMPTPPGPNNGTANAPAVPTAQASMNGTTVNYYNSTVTSNSTVGGAVSAPNGGDAGLPVPINGEGQAASSAASSAAAVDCDSASSVGVAGCADATLPSLARTDSTAGDVSSMWAGVQATPLFSAFSSISTAFAQGGSCPSASVTFTTIKFTGDFMTSFCQVFEQELPTMISISDAAWALLGLLILLSA
jgi:hypothetical protein